MAREREKQGGEAWGADMKATLGFEWQGSDLLNGGPAMLPTSTTGSPLALLGPTNASPGATPSLSGVPLPGADVGPTEEERRDVTNVLGELNRASAKALHLIASADTFMTDTFMNGSMSAGEQELSKSAIDQLVKVAEEAEEMALPLSRCVTFQKVSLEGGYTGTNLKF